MIVMAAAVVPGRESGTFSDHGHRYVTPDMRSRERKCSAPCSRSAGRRHDEAIAIENASPYGNAAAVFTESGGVARQVMERASAGMIGVTSRAGAARAILIRGYGMSRGSASGHSGQDRSSCGRRRRS